MIKEEEFVNKSTPDFFRCITTYIISEAGSSDIPHLPRQFITLVYCK